MTYADELEEMLCAILKQLEINYKSKDGSLLYFHKFLDSAEENGKLKRKGCIRDFYCTLPFKLSCYGKGK